MMPSTLQYTYARSADQPYAIEMLPLPETHKTALLAEARGAFRKLFSAMTIAKNGSDATVVAGLSGVTTTKTIMICTTTTVYGTLDEVAQLYVADESAIVLDFAESKRLYTFERPSKAAPMRYSGMRWSRWKSPSVLVTDRDLVYVEFADAFVDPVTGRNGWARCTKSIVHPCCPESQHPYGPVRAELFCSGMILRETESPGVLEVSTLVHIDTGGVPAFLAQKVLNSRKKTAQNVNHVLKLVRQMHGDATHEASTDDERGDSSATSITSADDRACRSCSTHVSKWTRARHCRHCDEILCKRCALINYTNVGIAGKTTRMCVDCGSGKKATATASASPASMSYVAPQHRHESSAAAADSSSSSYKRADRQTRQGSNRSIDTASTLDSFRNDAESTLLLLDDLHLRESTKQPANESLSASRVAASVRDEPQRRHQQRSQRSIDMQQQQPQQAPLSTSSAAANRQRMHSRQRGTSMLSDVQQQPQRRDAPVDLSYLSDLVSSSSNGMAK